MAITPSNFNKPRLSFSEVLAPTKNYFLNTTAGSGNTSSVSFVDYPGPIDKVIVKREPTTAFFVSGFVGAYKGTNTGKIEIGLLLDGVDYLIGSFFFNVVNTHLIIPFNVTIASSLDPGTYTTRVRWRTSSVNANADANDVINIRFDEGYYG